MYNVSISVMWMRICNNFQYLSEKDQKDIMDMEEAAYSWDEDAFGPDEKEKLRKIYDDYFDIDGSLKSQRPSGIK